VLRTEYGVVLAGGQQRLDGKVFRIGHLGLVNEKDIQEVLAALKAALPQAGFAPASGK
jgi:aspartate aminotransferase-like enzyme